jgi:hypothetical protein
LRPARTELHRSRYQRLEHDRASMTLQLEHVFTGVAVRPREPEYETLIEHRARPIKEFGEGGNTRRG